MCFVNNNFMRPNQNNKNRNRNRNNNNNNNRRNTGGGGGGSGNNKVFDSNGPDIKLRGTTQTIAEKYMQLGRDAQSSGDSVMAENYYQHAEHYYRLWAAAQPVGHSLQMSRKLGEEEFEEDGDEQAGAEDEAEGDVSTAEAGQPQDAVTDPNAAPQDGQQRQPRNQNFRDNNTRNFRPRWQNNRNNRNFENRENAPVEGAAPQETPVEVVQSAPAPVAQDQGQWEAPSFLQRPAPVVEATPENVAEGAPVQRRPRTRKPRVDLDIAPEAAPDAAE
jgi:Domain of unknown function (DUF4167)